MAPIAVEKTPFVSQVSVKSSSALSTLDDATTSSPRLLPVTLLSGFLGAGKTTLLERILTAPHGRKIGVIVNDMGALNIDGALLQMHHVAQTQERIVEMQNGCICCTLRGDLLEQVAEMAHGGAVEYLVIESSGISEPMQVAETFSEEFAEMHVQAGLDLAAAEMGDDDDDEKRRRDGHLAELLQQGGLSKLSRLDCCVTIVDALNVFEDYATADFLVDRHKASDVPEEDDRNVSDLQTDQIEFANVVIINKCDMVCDAEVAKIRALVKTLNPSAKIFTSVRSNVDVDELLDTRMFDYEQAALGAGWLRSLREDVKPETEEYGIGSFVYRARRPFHPARLWAMIKDVFVVIQEEFIDDGEEGEGEGGDDDDDDDDDADDDDDDDDAMSLDQRQPQLNPAARLASKKASATFAPLLRSKGFVWLATRPFMFGEWSQAGVMLTLTGGDVWRCCLAEDEWPQDEEVRNAIRRDFHGAWGDRRQEVVLIGLDMRHGGGQARLEQALNACLLDDAEWSQWQDIMGKRNTTDEEKKLAIEELFEDGFEDWKLDEHDHEGHDH